MLPFTISMASVGKVQLLAALDNQARELGLTVVTPADIFLLYTASDGAGTGKVYGGCAGEKQNGQWYVLFAYGPIGAAKIAPKAGVCLCAGPVTARNVLEQKRREKADYYRASWPGDRSGLAVNRCRCGTAYASGGDCHVCRPREAKSAAAADTRYSASPAAQLTVSRSAQLPPPTPKTVPAAPGKQTAPPVQPGAQSVSTPDTLDYFGTDKVRW